MIIKVVKIKTKQISELSALELELEQYFPLRLIAFLLWYRYVIITGSFNKVVFGSCPSAFLAASGFGW